MKTLWNRLSVIAVDESDFEYHIILKLLSNAMFGYLNHHDRRAAAGKLWATGCQHKISSLTYSPVVCLLKLRNYIWNSYQILRVSNTLREPVGSAHWRIKCSVVLDTTNWLYFAYDVWSVSQCTEFLVFHMSLLCVECGFRCV